MGQSAIGRVQPIYRGAYDSNAVYNKLDNVFYDYATWVCQYDNISHSPPRLGATEWQLVSARGSQGIQGNPGELNILDIGITTVEPSNAAWASFAPGSNAGEYSLAFGIPAGEVGFTKVSASAISVPAGQSPQASGSVVTIEGNRVLNLSFEIPSASGDGIKSIDGKTPIDGALNLGVVSYNFQELTNDQQIRTRLNINAQEAGDYLTPSNVVITNDATVTSNLAIRSTDLINDVSASNFNKDGWKLQFTDNNNMAIGEINTSISSNNVQSLNFSVNRIHDDVYYYNNSLSLGIVPTDTQGSTSYVNVVEISDPIAWKKALELNEPLNTDIMAADSGDGYIGETSRYALVDHYHKINVGNTIPNLDSASGSAGDGQIYARADHTHPLNGGASAGASAANIAKDGTAALGNSDYYALLDHVHPINVATDSSLIIKDAATASLGTRIEYARVDHIHPANVSTINPSKDSGTIGSYGASSIYARADHYHPLNVATTAPLMDADASYGKAETYARSDHRHPSDTTKQGLIKTSSITINTGDWTAAGGQAWYCYKNSSVVTENTKVDLAFNSAQYITLLDSGVAAMYTVSENGGFYVWAIGDAAPNAKLTSIQTVYYAVTS